MLPKVVIYDPELTLGLPTGVTGPSSFNALAHAVEALYAPGHNPVISALALEGVRAIRVSLPHVMEHPDDLDERSDLLYGAYLSGIALGATAPALHHKLSHVLGGTFNLVHADTHSVLLPHAVAFNAPVLPDEMARLAAALDAPDGDAAGALWDLAVASHVPTSLADLGLGRDDLPEAAERAATEITDNPRPFDADDLLALLQRAFDGQRPDHHTRGSTMTNDTVHPPAPAARDRRHRRRRGHPRRVRQGRGRRRARRRRAAPSRPARRRAPRQPARRRLQAPAAGSPGVAVPTGRSRSATSRRPPARSPRSRRPTTSSSAASATSSPTG